MSNYSATKGEVKRNGPLNMVKLLGSISLLLLGVCMVMAASVWAGEFPPPGENNARPSSTSPLKSGAARIWQAGVGEGFRAGTQVLSVDVGAMYGMLMFGSNERHHLTLATLAYGRMIGGIKGVERWYRGNWELRGELFGGLQFDPETSWVAGVAPHLRYNFATGTRWGPFIDIGAGVSWTGISVPDLGGSFQFNLQGSAGINWFVKDDMAVSLECRYLLLSSSGLSMPNNGVNTLGGLLGMNWFF